MRGTDDLATLVMRALAVQPAADATASAARYGGAEIRASEQKREQERQERLAEFASNADWATPAEIKAAFRTASIIGNNRVVFNICGNKYRLIVKVNYAYRVMYIRLLERMHNMIESTWKRYEHGD